MNTSSSTAVMQEGSSSSGNHYPYDTTPLGEPPLREWDLNENSTRYDVSHAAPSDTFLHNAWTAWSVLLFCFSLFICMVLAAILLSKDARTKVFNQYLIYLMIPDCLFTGICAIWCAVLSGMGGYVHPSLCTVQSFYNVATVSANSWLNGAVAYEIHRLLVYSWRRQRYFPPTCRSVALKAVVIYTWSAFIASWGLVPEWTPWLPHRINAQKGMACLPLPYDRASILFFFFCFSPLMTGIPLLYSVWVALDIVLGKKLPPNGRKRELAVYFFRVVVAFLVMWLPSIIGVYMAGSVSAYYMFFSGLWSHSQGVVSAALTLGKPDIWDAFLDLISCWGRCFDPTPYYRINKSHSNKTSSKTGNSEGKSSMQRSRQRSFYGFGRNNTSSGQGRSDFSSCEQLEMGETPRNSRESHHPEEDSWVAREEEEEEEAQKHVSPENNVDNEANDDGMVQSMFGDLSSGAPSKKMHSTTSNQGVNQDKDKNKGVEPPSQIGNAREQDPEAQPSRDAWKKDVYRSWLKIKLSEMDNT